MSNGQYLATSILLALSLSSMSEIGFGENKDELKISLKYDTKTERLVLSSPDEISSQIDKFKQQYGIGSFDKDRAEWGAITLPWGMVNKIEFNVDGKNLPKNGLKHQVKYEYNESKVIDEGGKRDTINNQSLSRSLGSMSPGDRAGIPAELIFDNTNSTRTINLGIPQLKNYDKLKITVESGGQTLLVINYSPTSPTNPGPILPNKYHFTPTPGEATADSLTEDQASSLRNLRGAYGECEGCNGKLVIDYNSSRPQYCQVLRFDNWVDNDKLYCVRILNFNNLKYNLEVSVNGKSYDFTDDKDKFTSALPTNGSATHGASAAQNGAKAVSLADGKNKSGADYTDYAQMAKDFDDDLHAYLNRYANLDEVDMALVYAERNFIDAQIKQYFYDNTVPSIMTTNELSSRVEEISKDMKDKKIGSESIELFNTRMASALVKYERIKSARFFYDLLPIQATDTDEITIAITVKEGDKIIDVRTYTIGVKGGVKIDFSTGLVVTNLRDDHYTTVENVENGSTVKRITKEDRGSFTVGFAAMLHVYFRQLWSSSVIDFQPGFTVGAMVSENAVSKYLVGASFILGKNRRFVLSTGWSFGLVKRLATGFIENGIFTGDNNTVPTTDSMNSAWFVAFTYNL